MKFYFTYGLDPAFPFTDGWTEIEAPDIDTAGELFRCIHPNRSGDQGFLNCAGIYPEELFKATRMYQEDNFGGCCHERISLTRELLDASGQTAPPEGGPHATEN